jgi:hypothetical protein
MKLQDQQNKNWDLESVISFMNFFFGFNPYSYQKRFIEACLKSTRIAAKFPRQSGKSFMVANYCLFKSITSIVSIVIVSPTQSQSDELYNKIRDIAIGNPVINKLIVKDTQTELKFANGSRIISLPCGNEGRTIRGYTADIVILEESGHLKDVIVNTVVIPMLASRPNGQIIKIGTPWTRNHFYRSCFEDTNYIVISIDWKEVVAEGQYTQVFIDEQRGQLLDIEFQTEYSAEFFSDANSFFPTSILEECKLSYGMFIIL